MKSAVLGGPDFVAALAHSKRVVIITKPKRELITSETETAFCQHSSSCCGRPFNVNNNFTLLCTLALVDATKSDWASTPTQPAAHTPVNIEEVVQRSLACSTTTVQAQSAANILEEGIRGLPPSSSEISLPADPTNIPQPHYSNMLPYRSG